MQESRPGEGSRQGVEKGAGLLGQLLMGTLELASSRVSLTGQASPPFAVEPSSATWGGATRGGVAILDMGASLMSMRAATFIAPRRLPLCEVSQKGQKSNLSDCKTITPHFLFWINRCLSIVGVA